MSQSDVPPLRADPGGLGPGEALTQAREEHDLPVEEMARRLRLPVAVVRALEACDRAALPETAYVLGYVRAYARMLDLDPEPYVAAYKSWLYEASPESGPHDPQRASRTPRPRRAWVRWTAPVVLAAVAAVAVWWWQTGGFSGLRTGGGSVQSTGQAEPPGVSGPPSPHLDSLPVTPAAAVGPGPGRGEEAPASPLPSSPVSGPEETGAAEPETPVPAESAPRGEPGGPPVDHEAGASAPQAPAPAPVAMPAAAPPADGEPHRIELRFNAQSWTEVYDSNGKRLLFDLYKPGQTKVVEGKPPFRIRLGYADGVELIYNGRTVDLGRYVRPDKTARFTLGDSAVDGESR